MSECTHVCCNCGLQFARKTRCACNDGYYCSKQCQEEDWKEHRKTCILHCRARVVTVDKVLLSEQDVAALLYSEPGTPLVDTAVKRKFMRHDAPGISMSIYPHNAINQDICMSIREKQKNTKGFGSVAVYDNKTREVVLYRYAVENAYKVLQDVIKGLWRTLGRVPKQIFLHTDIPSDQIKTMFSEIPDDSIGLDYVHIFRDDR